MTEDRAQFQFFGSLKDFFRGAPAIGPVVRDVSLNFHTQLKDTIESLGVPHCEVDAVNVNRVPEAFERLLKDGDVIQVYPVFEDPGRHPSLVRLEPYVGEPRFFIDCNLGKLNSLMRSLGFDCAYEADVDDAKLVAEAVGQNRIILTKDVRLLMRKPVVYGYWVRNVQPEDQLREVMRRYDLWPWVRWFSRCTECNVPLVGVRKEDVLDRLEPLTIKYYDEFYTCPSCQKIFWEGSHFRRLSKWRERLERDFDSNPD